MFMLTFVLYKCFYCTVINSYMYSILIYTVTPPAVSLQGKNNTCVSAILRYTYIHTHTYAHVCAHTHTQAATVTHGVGGGGCHQEALCAIEGLEDSGYLEHDRASLRVIHPLGAVQRILQHIFKRCTQTQVTLVRKILNKTSNL